MKKIQKIASIVYSVWAIFRSYILVMSIAYSTAIITMDGVKFFTSWKNISIFTVLSLLVPLSLLASSVFIVCNSFVKKYSFKREICSLVWLGINIGCLIVIPQISYAVSEMVSISTLFNIYSYNDPLFNFVVNILSANVLIAITLINIVLIALKIGGCMS